MKELIGAYWSIAYKEGSTGVSHGSEAQEVLSRINDELDRMTAENQCLSDSCKAVTEKCKELTTELAEEKKTSAALVELLKNMTAERDAAKETVLDWMRANGRGGWIDDLRNSVNALRADAENRTGDLIEALMHDCENGVKWFNENAADDFKKQYPNLYAAIAGEKK